MKSIKEVREVSKRSHSHSAASVDARRVLGADTPFAVREAYKALYTNILYLPIQSKCRKFVLTSACAGEGKTSVSINLAYTIAMTSPQAKVLLIDADMRNPRIPKLLELPCRGVHGLSEYLAGIDEVPNMLETVHPNLSFLPSGAESINTAALLSSSTMNKLMDFCDRNFDYVIIDTPPLNVVTDALFFNDHVDGFMLVARADYSDVNSVDETLQVLANVEANVIGFILCSLDTKRIRKYGGRYGKYGKYSRYDSYKYSK